jgi:two-component system cell cycle sensor histidine kinase PleC
MRGAERRIYGPGRRAQDRLSGPPAWLRILILTVTLAVAAYVLLFAREVARPMREADALREQALHQDARLLAAATEARLAPVRIALDQGAEALRAGARPLDVVERARAMAPAAAFAVLATGGEVRAAGGAEPSTFAAAAPMGQHPALAADRAALLLGAPPAPAGRLVARIAPPPGFASATRAGASRLMLVSSSGVVVASSRAADLGRSVRPVLGLEIDALKARARPAPHQAPSGEDLILAAAPLDTVGLTAVASSPISTGAAALLDDAWVLAAPLVLGLAVLLLGLLQRWRQARASRQWAAAEARFRVAVEAARCGVWEWDLEGEEVTLSDYMAAMLGFEAGGPVPAEAVIARIHPRYRDPVLHALRQAATFGAFEVTFPVPGPDGRARWIDARGQARGDRGEDGFSVILGVALDITEARRAKAQAQSAESRLRDGIESVSDAFVLFDRQGRLILWNQAFKDAFGFEDAVVRKGAQKDELNRIAALAIRSDHPAPGGRVGAREVELHDGRWLQLTERFTSEGGSVVTAADITAIKLQEAERQRAADSLRAMVDQLEASQEKLSLLARKYEIAMTRAEAANQAKSEFLANMSHELRTPLNAINGFSEIMSAEMFGPLGDARYKGYAADILQSGQHLLSLINDILDMAKIEAGKLSLHYETVSLQEICEDAIRLMRGKVEDSRLTLTLEAAADLPDLEADQRGCKQVMLNLISNAVKFTPEGGAITVALSRSAPGRLRVTVADTGIGIAAEDLERLARPFEQVEGQHSKTTQGTGLGLALTKALIELHGGTLAIESEPGRGTTVAVDLPIRRPVEQQARAA